MRLIVALIAVAAAGGCKNDPSTGSETHWMLSCSTSDACSEGQVCVCGICTVACEASEDCTGAGLAAECAAADAEAVTAMCAPETSPTGMCLSRCDESTECGQFEQCEKPFMGPGFCRKSEDGPPCGVGQPACPPSSRCLSDVCTCDPQPTCSTGSVLRCAPTDDPTLNCLDCSCD